MIIAPIKDRRIISDLVGSTVVPYFTIVLGSSKTVSLTERNLGSVISSITIHEKIGEMMTVELGLYDINGLISYLFQAKNGTVRMEWGIKKLSPAYMLKLPDEMDGKLSRGEYEFNIANIGDIELRDGIATTTVTLRVGGSSSTKTQTRRFDSGTVRDLITKLTGEINARTEIDYIFADKELGDKFVFMQDNETNLSFLRKLAIKLNAKLVVEGSDAAPLFIGLYDQGKKGATANQPAKGKWHYLDYGNSNSNIISGKLQTNNGGGSGSTASVTPDGKLVFTASQNEMVTVYELDTNKVKAALDKENLKSAQELVTKILMSSTDDLYGKGGLYEKYFSKSAVSTYPEGQGYTCSFEIVGSPLFRLNDKVWLGSHKEMNTESNIPVGFRSKADNAKSLWYFAEITTTLTEGYKMSVELGR